MKPEQAIQEATRGDELRPVYVVVGEERLLVDRVVAAIRGAANEGGVAGFNDERFTAGDIDVETIIAAARTVPMMAARRVVSVQAVERWERNKEGTHALSRSPLDVLADYAADPVPSTVLLIIATKLHGGRKLSKRARKQGYLVKCESPPRRELPSWISGMARERGHALSRGLAESLAELLGPELGPVADALERLSLYVGAGAPITEEAVASVVTRVRQDTVWSLVDSLAQQQLGPALTSFADVFDPREGGLRLLGAVTWKVRQLIKYDAARRAGQPPTDAAKLAGVAGFKAQEVERTVRAVRRRRLEHWLDLVAQADMALKGSRREHGAVLETLLVDMCR